MQINCSSKDSATSPNIRIICVFCDSQILIVHIDNKLIGI